MTHAIFGYGYLGRRVAQRWLDAGHAVCAVRRSPPEQGARAAPNLVALAADVTKPESLPKLDDIDTVLYSVGYDRSGQGSRWGVYVDGLAAVLDRLPPTVRRIVYISSTGVYGQTAGEWVDEDTPPAPTREAAEAFVAGERLLAEHPLGAQAVVLRLAGLYGPGRVPLQKAILAGGPLAVPAEGCLNLIHVDDAAEAVLLAAAHPRAPRTYLVSDGHPVSRRDYFRQIARLLGAPPPEFTAPDDDTPAAQRGGGNKRVANQRLLEELGIKLRYPSYREGLTAILRESKRGRS